MTLAASSPFQFQTPLLSDLLVQTADIVSGLGPQFLHYYHKLNDLASLYSEGRFHLAVLGQFKRGKSTLLNALTGEPILPVGVVPLTAAPTFLQYGEVAKITIQYNDSRPANEFTAVSIAERNAFLADFVTEKGNPKNKQGVSEVQVNLPTCSTYPTKPFPRRRSFWSNESPIGCYARGTPIRCPFCSPWTSVWMGWSGAMWKTSAGPCFRT